MSDILSKIFAVIIALGLMIIFPIMHMANIQEDTTKVFVLTEVTRFVDTARDIGYISPESYKNFAEKLAATDNIYEIEIEHLHKVFNPIYADPMDVTTFQDDYNANYMGHYSHTIMDQLFPSYGSGTNYLLSKGDYITVQVINKNKTFGTKIKELIFGIDVPDQTIFVRYGGAVRYEGH